LRSVILVRFVNRWRGWRWRVFWCDWLSFRNYWFLILNWCSVVLGAARILNTTDLFLVVLEPVTITVSYKNTRRDFVAVVDAVAVAVS
jgi:hypothetical protein